eukprot:TRINITY_DN7568_c0_g1_i21.p1 TRINITY_DN7568_c0_g1~~TRINITY_DN7568_c0_g1_i21.p1  ORF type:complete len:415 (+),score=112.73 TRINITY_DN7568_c0_g1_i21:66-1310(+)
MCIRDRLRKAASGISKRMKTSMDRTEKQVQKSVDNIKKKYRPKFRKMITGNEDTRVSAHLKKPTVVRMTDRISFFVSVNAMLLAQYFIIAHPAWFKWYYTALWSLLFPWRLFTYWQLKYALFMLDHCYFDQFLNMLLLHFFPESKALFYVCYVFAMGPLGVSIVLWRNSLVFHDVDKVTSVFLHIMPSLLMHCLMWTDPTYSKPEFNLVGTKDILVHMLAYPTIMYFVWQLGYLLVTELMLKHWLAKRPDQQTSLRWLGTDPKFSLYILCDKIFKKTLGFIPPGQELSDLSLRAKFVFVLTQFVFTIICMLMPMALVSSQTANSVWLCFLFMCCTWNGASFYIEVFSRRYAVKAFPPADSPRSKSSPRQPARQQVASSGVTRGLGAGQDPNPNPNPTQPASKAPAVSAADQKQD